ncbi:MAG: hypothetical protein RIQ94_1725 [Pseudomonadota bacterium]
MILLLSSHCIVKKSVALVAEVFLCIPNFKALSPPFSIKHGEYRTTACDSRLLHTKNFQLPPKITGGLLMLLPTGKKSKHKIVKHLK